MDPKGRHLRINTHRGDDRACSGGELFLAAPPRSLARIDLLNLVLAPAADSAGYPILNLRLNFSTDINACRSRYPLASIGSLSRHGPLLLQSGAMQGNTIGNSYM